MAATTFNVTKEVSSASETARKESSTSGIADPSSLTSPTTKEHETTPAKRTKLKDPFWWLSDQQKHRALCSFVFTSLTAGIAWDVVVIMPNYYKEFNGPALRHLFVQTFFYFNIVGNILYTMFLGVSIHRNVCATSADKKPGWRYCDACKLYLPPRSHHCKVCNFCVLKRDHHCVITGTCISFMTHRYFLMILFHFWVGGIYNLCYHFELFWNSTGSGMVSFGLSLCLPHVAVLLGIIRPFGYFTILLQLAGVMITGGVSVLLALQLYAVVRGQTMFEMGRGITTYDCGFLQNIRNTLGIRWYLVWLSPILPSPLPGKYGDCRKK